MTRYRIPTHLTVEPSLIRTELGPFAIDLTFRQATILACAAGLLYWLWQGSGWPVLLAAGASVAVALLAVVSAFVTIGGRSADLWLHDALHHAVRPRRLVWLADEAALPETDPAVTWADAPLRLIWSPAAERADPVLVHGTAD
jgi:hypothetical protein